MFRNTQHSGVNKIKTLSNQRFSSVNRTLTYIYKGGEMKSASVKKLKFKPEAGPTYDHSVHDRPVLGISACLLGQPVRFDGGHKKNQYILHALAKHIDFVSTCPELEAGFGLPRPTMQLRQINNETRLVYSKYPETDVTLQMRDFAEQKVHELSEVDGFIFKKDSPSCGVFRVPIVMHKDGMREKSGVGIFADSFQKLYPLIPVEEEGRLNDAALCENFFERVYAYRRWKAITQDENSVQDLIEFHSRHKFMLMARGSEYYQELGRMVAGTTAKDLAERRERYITRFMQVMKIISRPGRHVNVLQHIMGYLKQKLSADDKQELLAVFESYKEKQTPLITPLTLLRHHLRVNPQQYIAKQHYLDPFPEQLALRSSL